MTQFRKKPVVIEATQWFNHGDHPLVERYDPQKGGRDIKGLGPYGWVKTLEGGHIVSPGDWIIKGVKGEFYPCKPDIFAATYEAALTALPVVDPGPDSLEREIQAKANKAPRVTPDALKAEIVSESYFTAADGVLGASAGLPGADLLLEYAIPPLSSLTFCVLVLRNGFAVHGVSACASPENFNAEIGRRIARENAEREIWPLLGFRLRDQLDYAKAIAPACAKPEQPC
jgi:hypothetical protein